MDMLIGYESALKYWRTAGPRFLRGYDARQSATRRARRAAASKERPALPEGNRRPAGCTLPLEVLVGDPGIRTRTPSVTSCFWSDLPERSFIDAGNGFLVSTPEFCFLQMANRLSVTQLMMLGYELCGTYVLVDKGPAPRRDAPLTTVAKLRAFAEGAPNARGRKKALRALRSVLDRSASPMESVLAMLLSLPYSLGGYGLAQPSLNFRVDVPPRFRKLADRTYCACDLCWPEARLAVEYDSRLHHADPERQESDARRRSTLTSLGFTVVTVSRAQAMDSGSFNRLAHQLAKLLGKRLRYVDPGFTHTHLGLRDELLEAVGMHAS